MPIRWQDFSVQVDGLLRFLQDAVIKTMPDFAYIRRELQRNGVNKKLLWTEYL